MAVVRRFLIASAYGRIIRRERGVTSRIVEGHFPPRPDRRQFVRVERDECLLVLAYRTEGGEQRTEPSVLPLSHAEALLDVAPGRVAFDRTEVPLGLDADGWLDRLVVPSGPDLLTVQITSDPRLFAPPLWFGVEVTDKPSFESGHLALYGSPTSEAGEVTNDGLEALLDWVEGKSIYSPRAGARSSVAGPPETATLGGTSPLPAATETAVIVGEVLPAQPEGAEAGHSFAAVYAEMSERQTPDGVEAVAEHRVAAQAGEAAQSLPRRPTLRGGASDLEDGIARLARSLAPRRVRPSAPADPAE